MVELCREAYVLYQDEVVKQKWIYTRFVEDYLSGHECCDALDATSINENARSLRTMKTLLWRRKDLVLRYFGMVTLTDEQIKEMIYLLNTTNSSGNDYSTSSQLSQHSLLSCLDAHDYELIADCCNHHCQQSVIPVMGSRQKGQPRWFEGILSRKLQKDGEDDKRAEVVACAVPDGVRALIHPAVLQKLSSGHEACLCIHDLCSRFIPAAKTGRKKTAYVENSPDESDLGDDLYFCRWPGSRDSD